jgi:UPF0176 protein
MYHVSALYKFVPLDDFRDLQKPLLDECQGNGIVGTLLLAPEGINGTIAGSEKGMAEVLAYLRRDPRLADIIVKHSHATERPFHRMKVRLKKEIVTLGETDAKPYEQTGRLVQPEDWNELIEDPEVLLLDTRNTYETHIGSFQGAIDPRTFSFTQIKDYIAENLDDDKDRKIAMFCTGGIRCEKLSSHMLNHGYKNIFQLHGGILRYLEEVPQEQSLWEGECFVFDHRVSVGHGMKEGEHIACHACGHPLDSEDCQDPAYEEGVHCPFCSENPDPEKLDALRERQRQIQLARERGTEHIGLKMP